MRDIRLSRIAGLVVAALVASSCDDSSTGPTSLQVTVVANPAAIAVDGSSTIVAQVTTNLGQPAVGVPLEWSNSFARMLVSSGSTDATGRSSATLQGEGVAGVAVVTARVVGREERSQVEVRIGPG